MCLLRVKSLIVHIALSFIIMSKVSILEKATELADTNPDAARLMLELSQAESGGQIMSALDSYDEQIAKSVVSAA